MAKRQWTVKQANDWYATKPWPVGCNFLPSTAINDTEMWQGESFDPATIDRELGWAAKIGFNSVRVFLQYKVYEADPAGFKARFEQFLSIAASHGITMMPLLFDDCCFAGKQPYLGKQDAPVPGVHNSGWVPSPGSDIAGNRDAWPRLRQYVLDMLGTFGKDERVLVWDLYNEPGANPQFAPKEFLQSVFEWAWEGRPSQPMTIGPFQGNQNWTDELSQIMLEGSDVVSFHCYVDTTLTNTYLETFRKYQRPMFCTEWMARILTSTFQTHLPLWKAEKIGCYNWGLVAGKTQTFMPWGSAPGTPEPELWLHDIFRLDGTPYKQEEIDAIRKATGR